MELNYRYAESTVKPAALEVTEGTVYLRKEIASITRSSEQGDSIVYWTYQEAALTPQEFNDYTNLVMAENAIKGTNDSDNIVKLMFLQDDEEAFAELLADKTNKDLLAQKKHRENELQKSVARQKTVENLYERLYEDNISGKVSDEWFMQLSHKYEVERMELKAKISALHSEISELDGIRENKEHFIRAIRKFMQMDTLTAPLLRELIERIDVYEVKGTGKNRTQQLLIHYKFVGCIDIPEVPNRSNFTQETRKGVAVEYIPKQLAA